MKKTTLFSLLFLTLTIVATGSARTLKYVELGINQSKFRNEACKSKIGPSFGIGLDYYPINSLGAFVGSGLLYQNKKLLVEDRTWPIDIDPRSSNQVVTGDLDISISYLEIPLKIGYSIIIKNQFSSSIFTGYSLSIPVKDHTKVWERDIRELAPDERGTYDFDYVFLDEAGVAGNLSTNYHIDLRLGFNRFIIFLSYVRALSSTDDILGWTIHDKIDTFRISFAYMF